MLIGHINKHSPVEILGPDAYPDDGVGAASGSGRMVWDV